jgi:hypothetical protein
LVIALMLVWMVGLAGATQGCQTIDVLHRPDAVRAAMNHITDVQMARRQEALIETVLAFRTMVTPFAVGQLILGTLLTLTAGLTLLGRGQARRLAVQAILAYSLFLPIDYIVRRPMRASAIDAVASDLVLSPLEGGVAPEMGDLREVLWWAARGVLGGQLAILIAGLVVMTRPRVRAFFGTMAGEQPGRLEP